MSKNHVFFWNIIRGLVSFLFGILVITVVEEAYYGYWNLFQVIIVITAACFLFIIGYFTGKHKMLNKRFDAMPLSQINNKHLLKKMQETKNRSERVTTIKIYK